MKAMRCMRQLLLCLAAGWAAAAPALAAEPWPARPVRIIVPFPAGGGVDFVARLVAQKMTEKTGQTFVVENRAGASGLIGADAVAKSPADGYTVLIASPAEVLVGAIAGQRTPYDAQRDLTPVTLAGETPLVIAVHPDVPAGSMQDLLAGAKQDGRLSYGTPGNGSTMHFAGESLNLVAGTSILHVPYKGAAPAVSDLLGNQIPVGIVGMPPIVPHYRSGKLKVLAVTSPKRSGAMPDVPAMAELPGFADYRFTNWMGVYVPAGTPQPVIEALAAGIGSVVREPDTRARLQEQGVEPVGSTPAEFAGFLQAERQRYEQIARGRNIRIE